MVEVPELNRKYLSRLKMELRATKKKFMRAHKFFCLDRIPPIEFFAKYCVPLTNKIEKIMAFESIFEELNVKFPEIANFDECRSIRFWNHYDTVVETFNYNGEVVDMEWDQYTNSFSEYWQNAQKK